VFGYKAFLLTVHVGIRRAQISTSECKGEAPPELEHVLFFLHSLEKRKEKKTETGSHMHNKTQPTNYIISFSDLYNWLIYTNINYKMSFHFCT